MTFLIRYFVEGKIDYRLSDELTCFSEPENYEMTNFKRALLGAMMLTTAILKKVMPSITQNVFRNGTPFERIFLGIGGIS